MRKYTNYKDYVGALRRWDPVRDSYYAFLQREHPDWDLKPLLEVGCGGLRIGAKLMSCMARGDYYGIEPNKEILEQALRQEEDGQLERMYSPHFDYNSTFDVSCFDVHFPLIISYAVFIHCGREQLETFLRNVHEHVKQHNKPTRVLLDLALGDFHEVGPPAYPHSSHRIVYYAHEEVAGFARNCGGELQPRYSTLRCDGDTRRQYEIIFEP